MIFGGIWNQLLDFLLMTVIYRKIINNEDMEKLQKVLDRLGEWAAENAMKINPSKSKAIRFTRSTKLFVNGHINTEREQL